MRFGLLKNLYSAAISLLIGHILGSWMYLASLHGSSVSKRHLEHLETVVVVVYDTHAKTSIEVVL